MVSVFFQKSAAFPAIFPGCAEMAIPPLSPSTTEPRDLTGLSDHLAQRRRPR
jgi:hypothetical protein